ncbi:MAG: hypothetical protein ABFD96_13765 [Armatimonadia bacterium]
MKRDPEPQQCHLELQRQLWALASLDYDFRNYLFLIGPNDLASDYYTNWLDQLLNLLTNSQRATLRPIIRRVIAAHQAHGQSEREVPAQRAARRLVHAEWNEPTASPREKLAVALSTRKARLEKLISKFPPCVDKTLDYLQAYVECETIRGWECLRELIVLAGRGRDVTKAAKRCLDHMRNEYQRHIDSVEPVQVVGIELDQGHTEHRLDEVQTIGYRRPSDLSHIFWVSRDFEELEDSTAFLQFCEAFDSTGLDTVIEHAQAHVQHQLLTATVQTSLLPADLDEEIGSRAATIALQFWPLVDAHRAAMRMRPALDIALDVLCAECSDEGFWVDPSLPLFQPMPTIKRRELLPSSRVTAAATLLLLRYGRSPRARHTSAKAVAWLLREQNVDGYWRDRVREITTGTTDVPDLDATCLALRALMLQSARDPGSAVCRGSEWLRGIQGALGDWHGSFGAPRNYYTLLAINTLCDIDSSWQSRVEQGVYLSTCEGLIERAQEVLMVGDEVSLQISLLLAFQALELFLYSCLELPTIGASVFDKKSNQSIGYDKALVQLEEYLRSCNRLRPGQHVRECAKLQRLKYHRDEVVHKGARVSLVEASAAVRAAVDFIHELSLLLHGRAVA